MGDFRVSVSKKFYVAVFCSIVGVVYSTGMGKCPVYPQFPHFDIQRMTGIWYEVERSFYIMEMTASCTELNVTVSNSKHWHITVTTINRWSGAPSVTQGLGIPSHDGSSYFRYRPNNRLPYIISRLLPGSGQYNILFTDYDNFALVWSCTSVTVAHSDRIWVLGRRREIEAEVRAQIYAIMEGLGLDPDRLIVSKNNNCTDVNNIN